MARFMYSLCRAYGVLRFMHSDGGLYRAYWVLRFMHSDGGLHRAYGVLRFVYSDVIGHTVLKFM